MGAAVGAGAEPRNDVVAVGPADGGAAWKSAKSSSTTKNAWLEMLEHHV